MKTNKNEEIKEELKTIINSIDKLKRLGFHLSRTKDYRNDITQMLFLTMTEDEMYEYQHNSRLL